MASNYIIPRNSENSNPLFNPIMKAKIPFRFLFVLLLFIGVEACKGTVQVDRSQKSMGMPKAKLTPSEKFVFNSFVDCNMATVWVKAVSYTHLTLPTIY